MDVNAAKDKTKVNVIAIQCESWWDPAKLENVTMSEDPMKNIRALGEKYYFGDMVSPSFGCNTCIPEFEYLTFLSTNLLPEGGYPYSQYVRKPIYSLARIFKDNGYNGDLTSKQAGSVGGQMVKKMIESYEMSNKQ